MVRFRCYCHHNGIGVNPISALKNIKRKKKKDLKSATTSRAGGMRKAPGKGHALLLLADLYKELWLRDTFCWRLLSLVKFGNILGWSWFMFSSMIKMHGPNMFIPHDPGDIKLLSKLNCLPTSRSDRTAKGPAAPTGKTPSYRWYNAAPRD